MVKGSEWNSRKWEREMKPTTRKIAVPLMLLSALALCLSAAPQQTTQSAAQRLVSYDVSREVSLIGIVVKYDAASAVPPMGAHVLLQTSSGQVGVHLGSAQLLRASHFDLNPGDNVRIVGETLTLSDGTFFAARIVQKGAQAIAVRNARGFLLTPASTLSQDQKQALRGVR
jgi:hypothetical protein